MHDGANKTVKPAVKGPGWCYCCGAARRPERETCWMCRAPLKGLPEGIVQAEVVPEPPPFAPATATFSLSSLLAVVTVIAVGLGLARWEPGLGILFGIVTVPAIVITAVRTRNEIRRTGREVGWLERVITFVASSAAVLGMLMLLQFALLIALIALCLVLVFGYALFS